MAVQGRHKTAMLSFDTSAVKLIKISKRRPLFPQSQRHLSVDTFLLLPVTLSYEEQFASRAAVLAVEAELFLSFPPSLKPAFALLSLPKHSASQSSLTPSPLYSICWGCHLLSWHCFMIWPHFSSSLVKRLDPSHHPSRITRKLEKKASVLNSQWQEAVERAAKAAGRQSKGKNKLTASNCSFPLVHTATSTDPVGWDRKSIFICCVLFLPR